METSNSAEPPGPTVTASSSTSQLRTFLFADVRGYTRFTQDHGDEAAAELVQKFEGIARESARNYDGQVIETRGDEILAVFTSARQALRAAVDMQARSQRETEVNPLLPLTGVVGIEAGEAVE